MSSLKRLLMLVQSEEIPLPWNPIALTRLNAPREIKSKFPLHAIASSLKKDCVESKINTISL